MYDKPTNNETNLIRNIFANSSKEVVKPEPTQLDEGWMAALMKALGQTAKGTGKGAAKAGKTAAKTPENIPGVKVGKPTKSELPALADRTMPKAEEPVRTGGMSPAMKTGAAVAAGTMAVGSLVAPFMVGGEQKKEPTLFPQGTGMEKYTISPTSPGGYIDPNKKWMPSIPAPVKPAPAPVAPAPAAKPAPVKPAPAPAVKPAPAPVVSAKPTRSEEELTKIVPGSQTWGELSGEEQRKIAKHYASGKSSLSIRHREGKGFDQPGYAEGTGQYGDIVSALNKVQMQESYYNRLSSKLDEAMGIEQSAYGFNPKGGRKVHRLAKRFEQEPMVSWSGDSATVEDLPAEPSQDMHATDAEAFVKKHVMDLMSAAQEKGIEMTHGEAHKIATQRLKQHLGQAD